MFKLPSDVGTHLRGGGTLLVPTAQRAHAVQLAEAARQLAAGARVWASADVITPAAWARRTCERAAERVPGQWPRLLTATEEWLLWREVARETAGRDSFLDKGVLGESLQRSSERAAAYGVALTTAAPGSEADFLYRAQRLFEARCRDMSAASASALTARLQGTSDTERLLLRGFDASVPRLAALAPNRAAAVDRPSPPLAMPRVVRTAEATSQVEAIAYWCRARLAAQPDARLLVMLPGPAGERERLAAHVRADLDPGAQLGAHPDRGALVAIEGGDALASLALPSQALLTLALLSGSGLDVESVCRWLTAPYWRSPAPAPRSALALQLRARRVTHLNLREFLGALQLAPAQLKAAARELDALLRQAAGLLGEGSATPRRWSERFEAALAALGWPGSLPPESAVHQTRLRWRALLEEFGGLVATVDSLGRDAALELLRALALRTAYRPANEDVPVTISPMLADPVAIYDGIWVASLSAEVLPQPVAPDPFLPHRAQLAAGMPEASAAGRRLQAHTLLAAWRAGTQDLVLSVPAREGDLELLPSPSLTDLAFDEAPPRSLWLPLRLHRAGCTEALVDTTGTAFNPRAPLPLGTRALTLQNACAFRAYAELRLGATPPEHPEPGVPMDQRGLLLHAALQLLWDRLRESQALRSLDERALDALIGDCVSEAARTLQSETRGRRRGARRSSEGQYDLFTVLSPALSRECQRAQQLIRRLCDLERTRAPFTVEATEHVLELALGGGRLRMRLDRVDRIAGGCAVLDYKSGRPGHPDWHGERPTHPQLLAYSAALGSEVLALATINLTAREVRFAGVAAQGDLLPRVKGLAASPGVAVPDWSAQQRRWRALIERLIRDFLAGEARVDPAPGACDYCHAVDLCRIGAHHAPEPPTHADETDE